MNVEIAAEAALFPEKEYINRIAVEVWEVRTLEKSYLKSLLIALRIIYIRALDMAPPSVCVT